MLISLLQITLMAKVRKKVRRMGKTKTKKKRKRRKRKRERKRKRKRKPRSPIKL